MPISAAQFDFVRDLVRRLTGIEIDAGKEYLVELRLSELAHREQLASLDALFSRLASATAVDEFSRKVAEAMTNNETSFFRDWQPFVALRDFVLPALIKRNCDRRQLSIWCAGCASGQEPYSLAMLLAEHFPQLAGWSVSLIASDVSRTMIARAKEGRYNRIEVNRGLPAPLLVKYFQAEGECWRIREALRHAVDFREINLNAAWPSLPLVDLVLMRNVMIYFSLDARRTILRKLTGVLHHHGFLLLGGSETTVTLDDRFNRSMVGNVAFFQPK